MSRVIRFIGDIHGKYQQYFSLIDRLETESIQIGDFGFGFGARGKAEYVDDLFDEVNEDKNIHRFIRGNHDDPDECKKSTRYIDDGHLEDNMMFVGGGLSIDKQFRTPGISWWEGEELSMNRLADMIAIYEKNKPEIMVTHETPEFIAKNIMIPAIKGYSNFPSRTRDAFDVMYQKHAPRLWIFGHWHHHIDAIVDNTRFICLPELGYIDVDVENVPVKGDIIRLR